MIPAEQTPTKTFVYTGPAGYSFPFHVTTETDVKVRYTDTLGVTTDLTYLTDNTVVLINGGVDGGTVTTTAPTSTDGTLNIYSDFPITQNTDWVNSGP